MLPAPFADALVLTGPTGAGKTELAIHLAQHLDAEIISMDSMALYRRMDVGTAKPTPAQRQLIPHHLVDVLEPWEPASVAWWLREASRCAEDITRRGKHILVVGGTPLYLKALLFGLFDGPPADEHLRSRLLAEADSLGPGVLHERLAAIDPLAASRLHPNDLRRIVRALEVFELTGQPISAWQQQWQHSSTVPEVPPGNAQPGLPAILWLDLPRPLLYDRINRRVEQMFAAGMVDEVQNLEKGDATSWPRSPAGAGLQGGHGLPRWTGHSGGDSSAYSDA